MKKINYCFAVLIALFAGNCVANEECLNMHVINSDPIGFITKKGNKTGTHWEYLEAIEQRSGVCIEHKLMPYMRIWESLRIGLHDGGIVFRSQSRTPLVEYVAHIRTVPTAVIPLAQFEINSYEDLHGITIGKIRGTHLSERFDSDRRINVMEMATYAQAAQMIRSKRIDAIAGSLYVVRYQVQKYAGDADLHLGKPFVLGTKQQWLQLSKQSPHKDKIPALRKAVESLKEDGTFDVIMARFYGDDWNRHQTQKSPTASPLD